MIPLHLLQKKKKVFKKINLSKLNSAISGVQIRGWPAQKHLFHQGRQVESPPSRPSPLSEGSKLRRVGRAGRGGAETAPSHLTPAVPSFSVQYRQCIQPSRG